MTELYQLPKHIVFDLDGTLVDNRKKYYAAYTDSAGGTPLPQSTYWRLKRAKKFPPSGVSFIALIESEKYLSLDTLFPFTHSVLKHLVTYKHILHLVSARRDAATGRKEVERLGIAHYFSSIDIGHMGSDVVATKTAFLNRRLKKGTQFALIGDTEDDVNTAKKFGQRVIAVSSGIRSATVLSQYKPDFLGRDVRVLMHPLHPFM